MLRELSVANCRMFLGCEYPGDHNPREASRELRDLVAADVDHFIAVTDERNWIDAIVLCLIRSKAL